MTVKDSKWLFIHLEKRGKVPEGLQVPVRILTVAVDYNSPELHNVFLRRLTELSEQKGMLF